MIVAAAADYSVASAAFCTMKVNLSVNRLNQLVKGVFVPTVGPINRGPGFHADGRERPNAAATDSRPPASR